MSRRRRSPDARSGGRLPSLEDGAPRRGRSPIPPGGFLARPMPPGPTPSASSAGASAPEAAAGPGGEPGAPAAAANGAAPRPGDVVATSAGGAPPGTLSTGAASAQPAADAGAAESPGAGRASEGTMRGRLSALLGDRKKFVLLLAVLSIFSGATEAATLGLIAVLATRLVRTGHGSAAHHSTLSILEFHQGTGTLILIGFALCGLRLVFQLPLATLSARIASDVQARLRTELFDAFNRASWSVQSRDREGQLQEVMTSQVMQAVAGAVNATSLISSGFQFIVLMASAFLFNPLAALIVGVLSITLFSALRPLRRAGHRSAKRLSRAQVRFAGGVAESNRIAEESHVFGAGAAQRARLNDLIGQAQRYFYRSQLLLRLVANL